LRNEKKKNPIFEFKRRARSDKEKIHQILKRDYDQSSLNKFIARDERKTKQARKCVERRKGPVTKITVAPTNIKGYK
jgi:hypothetical protein